ncbi:MAG: hypothetical protein AABY22_15635, partial [Nanoarchaeota archaeon]
MMPVKRVEKVTFKTGGDVGSWVGKKVKRKNLRGGYNYYAVLSYNDNWGYLLQETKTDINITATTRELQNEFEVTDEFAEGGSVLSVSLPERLQSLIQAIFPESYVKVSVRKKLFNLGYSIDIQFALGKKDE